MSLSEEQVLVFPAAVLAESCGGRPFQGVLDGPRASMVLASALAEARFMPRGEAEDDPAFKQLIPYVVLRRADGLYFRYRRSKKGGESRLHRKWSVGVGGHVNPVDGAGDGTDTYTRALYREVEEETGVRPRGFRLPAALINDDSDEVGRVHLGVVHLIDVPAGQGVVLHDPAVAEGSFVGAAELRRDAGDFEGWSRLVITHLLPGGTP